MFVTNIQFYCLKLIIMMTKNKAVQSWLAQQISIVKRLRDSQLLKFPNPSI